MSTLDEAMMGVVDLTTTNIKGITGPTMLSICANAYEPLVIVHMDGRLEYGPNYDPDKAAQVFWEAVARWGPVGEATVETAAKAIRDEAAEAEVARLREALTAIAQGYPVEVSKDRYIMVENPKHQPDDGSNPFLLIDVAALQTGSKNDG